MHNHITSKYYSQKRPFLTCTCPLHPHGKVVLKLLATQNEHLSDPQTKPRKRMPTNSPNPSLFGKPLSVAAENQQSDLVAPLGTSWQIKIAFNWRPKPPPSHLERRMKHWWICIVRCLWFANFVVVVVVVVLLLLLLLPSSFLLPLLASSHSKSWRDSGGNLVQGSVSKHVQTNLSYRP